MKVGELKRLLAGILSLVLIVGLGTPAFAQTPSSDQVIVNIFGHVELTWDFPETAEGGFNALDQNFGTGTLPPISGGLPPVAVVLTDQGGISDIILLDPQHRFCNTDICFVSDDDASALASLLDLILVTYPTAVVTSIEETGELQNVSDQLGFVGGVPVRVLVQSDVVEATPVGGEILPIDMTSLFIAGAMTNAFWMVPTLGGIAGAALALFKVKRRNRK